MPVVLALPYIGLFGIFRIKGAFTEAHGAMVMSSKCRMHIWQMNVILSFNAFSIYLFTRFIGINIGNTGQIDRDMDF